MEPGLGVIHKRFAEHDQSYTNLLRFTAKSICGEKCVQ